MADTTLELLDFNDKQENQSKNNRGRLTATEFNQLVDAVNANIRSAYNLTKQMAGLTLSVQESESAFDALESKDSNTVYFILEEE